MPDNAPMDERKKAAYRHLLYRMCLDLRYVSSDGRNPMEALYNLFRQKKFRTLHYAHHLADTFHNLADFSGRDFVGFDEERFWMIAMGIYERYCVRNGITYRAEFDEFLR
ncbi:MAG: hypothetical protein H8F28_12750 [Fibrella sp.]|nr:hypothetical protein [Armatimonadota bacterium]